MRRNSNVRQAILGSVAGLVVLNSVLLASFLTRVPPHPPIALGPLGGAGPFIGTTLTVSAVALLFVYWRSEVGYGVALIVVLQNLVTFGPHKLFEPSASLTYPAVVAGSVLTGVLLVASVSGLRVISGGTSRIDESRVGSETAEES